MSTATSPHPSSQPPLHPALRPVADGLWQVDGGALAMPLGLRLPVSSTLVRLPDRTLLLYSPVAIDDALAAAIDGLGEVAHLVAPNRFHHLRLGDAIRRWPRAVVHGAPGLAAKRPDLTFHRVLGAEAEPAWRDALRVVPIDGAARMSEVALVHADAGALICCDLLFNLGGPAPWRSRLAFAAMGVRGPVPAQSRAWRFFRTDATRARASIAALLAEPLRAIVPCHGPAYVAGDAREVVARACRRVCAGRVALPPAAPP